MRRRRLLVLVTVVALAGASLVVTAPAGAQGGGGGNRSVTVSPLAVVTSSAGVEGAVHDVTVRLDRRGGTEFRVGFSEDEVGGTGDEWRAAGWGAATVATLVSGSQLGGNDITFEINGEIDGGSAGGLMTVAVLSLFNGDKVQKDISMTGAINPDGTIGPVSGIPYKVQAAADAGFKRVLVPIGQRNAPDIDGNLIDVFDLGADAGVEVEEVEDIYQAYEAFTGKPLAQIETGGSAKLSSDAYDQLESFSREYLADYTASAGEFGTLDPAIQSVLVDLAVQADASAARADQLGTQGLQAGAFAESFESAAAAKAAVTTGRALQIYFTQGVDAFISQINASAAVSEKVDVLFDQLRIGAAKQKTLTEVTALIGAYSTAIDVLALVNFADQALAAVETATTEDEALNFAITGAVVYEIAALGIDQAKQIADIGESGGGKVVTSLKELEATADFFRKAASANLNAFDQIVIESIASDAGVDLDTAKVAFQSFDLEYALAVNADILLRSKDDLPTNRESLAYAKLGASVQLYSRSAALLGKYYSFDAETDDDGNVIAVTNERALTSALDFAEAQDEGVIGILSDKDVDPTLLVAGFETAGIDREGGPGEKLEGIAGYWYGYIAGRVIAYLGGFEREGLS